MLNQGWSMVLVGVIVQVEAVLDQCWSFLLVGDIVQVEARLGHALAIGTLSNHN